LSASRAANYGRRLNEFDQCRDEITEDYFVTFPFP
jgi:hypothetical protein